MAKQLKGLLKGLKPSVYHALYKKSDSGRESRHKTRERFRQYIFMILGNKCVRCGFADQRALQMDHINGRKGIKRLGNVDERYKFVRDNLEEAKKTYQILCANCNFIKREENHEHFYHGRKPL